MEWSQCVVSIRQKDARPYAGKLMAYLLVISEDIRTGRYTVASRREKSFELLGRGVPSIEFSSDHVGLSRNSQKSGSKYSGYLVVIRDKNGEIIATKSNRASFEEWAPRLVDQAVKTRFDGNGKPDGK